MRPSIRLGHNFLFPLSIFLSFPPIFPLSFFTHSHDPWPITAAGVSPDHTRWMGIFRGWQNHNNQLGSGPGVAVAWQRRGEVGHDFPVFKCRSLANFDGSSCFQSILLSSLFNMVPFVSDKGAQIVGTYFCAIRNFTSRFESNRALF